MESSKIKDEIALKYISQDIVALTRNGVNLVCPFIPPMAYQQQGSVLTGGQPQIMQSRSLCTSSCPLFQVDKNSAHVSLACGSGIMHQIDKIIALPAQDNKGEGKTINLHKS